MFACMHALSDVLSGSIVSIRSIESKNLFVSLQAVDTRASAVYPSATHSRVVLTGMGPAQRPPHDSSHLVVLDPSTLSTLNSVVDSISRA